MNCMPERLLDDLAQERLGERRRTTPRTPIPSPRTPGGRRRAARVLRRLADRLEPLG